MEPIQLKRSWSSFALKNGQKSQWLDVPSFSDIPQETCSCNPCKRCLYKVLTWGWYRYAHSSSVLKKTCFLFLSRPDLREPFYFSIWLGWGVIWVGILVFLFLFWPGMVPNQRQLSNVVSDWGSYLGSLFSTFSLWDLVGACVWCMFVFVFCFFGVISIK